MTRARVAIIVLAAGQGRRFGTDNPGPKVLAPFHGLPLVRAVVIAALTSRAEAVIVVTGPAHSEVTDALHGLGTQIVQNKEFASGMASSLKAALVNLPADTEGAIVMLADMPIVQPKTIDYLIARFEDRRPQETHAVVPVYEGRRGNPVLIGRRLFEAVQSLSGDQGARVLLQRRDLSVEFCDVDDPGITVDIDTLAELEALNQSD